LHQVGPTNHFIDTAVGNSVLRGSVCIDTAAGNLALKDSFYICRASWKSLFSGSVYAVTVLRNSNLKGTSTFSTACQPSVVKKRN